MNLSRRRFLIAGAGALVGGAGVLGYATWIEPGWLQIAHRTLPLGPQFSALRIVQLSDLHICVRADVETLERAFDITRSFQPDLVLYTGDFITFEGDAMRRLESLISSFPKGARGTFAVLGNHDYGSSFSDQRCAGAVTHILQKNGIDVLRNGSAVAAGIQIAGLDDLWNGNFNIAATLQSLNPALPAVVLCHNPDGVDMPGWSPYRGWILAGHTHGGQVKPPWLRPPLLPVKNKRYVAGEYRLHDGRTLYVSRGVGNLYPIRFNVRPEVTCFTVT